MLLEGCIQVAREAGALIRDMAQAGFQVEKKAAFDLVTNADRAAERLICQRLLVLFPESQLLAEEETQDKSSDAQKLLWIIDPIDGTINYARGIPHAAVSIAGYNPASQKLLVGCVYNPFSEECFWASQNNGAFLNGQPIKVSFVSKLEDALVATGFFNTGDLSFETSNLPEAYHFIKNCLGLRRCGAASLDLCWLAMGRFDIYWEKGLKPWDMAAGALIVQEAGGLVTDYQGNNFNLFEGFVLASNQHLHKAARRGLFGSAQLKKHAEHSEQNHNRE